MAHYDLIVLGTGGVGSAALYHAARRGLRCLGLDRFPPAHDRGSSHGESRLIRLSYFEHPDYVPLLRRSYTLWDDLDQTLLNRCGLFYAGPGGGDIIAGILDSAQQHQLDVTRVEAADFPQYHPPAGTDTLFEPDAGWLPVERCIQQHLAKATELGATHRWGETVKHWQADDGQITVETETGRYTGSALALAGGAWTGELLADLGLPLTVTRKHLHWFACDDERYRNGFFMELPQGQYYGFPTLDGRLKVAEHSGGEAITDPLRVDRSPDPQERARVEAFVAAHLPGVSPQPIDHVSCFYTMTPDSNFVVDRHPDCDNVSYVAGLSGHGFKMAPALGEMLVDLATGHAPTIDIDFLSRERFAA